MKEREQNLMLAACEVVGDFKSYGPVLQKSKNDDYGPESSIGKLGDSLLEYQSEEFTCETDEKTHLENGKVVFAKDRKKIKESEVLDSIRMCMDALDMDGLAKLYNSLYEGENITGDDIIPFGDENVRPRQ